jgi:DNA primase
VNFIMEHEHLTYPDALRYVARKYNIEIEEAQLSAEDIATQNERESVYLVAAFAQKIFTETLINTEDGRAIALSYFKERGFSMETIQKFQLGYSIDTWSGFTDAALAAGYKLDYLVRAGLTIKHETPESEGVPAQTKTFDRFSGRVIFPVHNQSGRVIAFGGRTLKTDKKIAKYINSPETEIYHKSNVLYGMYFAKKSIVEQDNCFLVEGYTDVISMFQAGVENVVASSGTSLTVEQIKQIKRYTRNITILYDGDSAGIKASFRGIDLILEEDMNVKVLLFPDGEDPDSFSKKTSGSELKEFIQKQTKDFISFKTSLLLGETENDPIKKSELIRNIVQTIALIPDGISRSVYLKECSRLLDVAENVLLNELNKIRRDKVNKSLRTNNTLEQTEAVQDSLIAADPNLNSSNNQESLEREMVRLLFCYANKELFFESVNEETQEKYVSSFTVASLFCTSMSENHLVFKNLIYGNIYNEFLAHMESGKFPEASYFINNDNLEIQKLCVDLISVYYELCKWDEKHGIIVSTEENNLKKIVIDTIYKLKLRHIQNLFLENQEKLKEPMDYEAVQELMAVQRNLINAKVLIAGQFGTVVLF